MGKAQTTPCDCKTTNRRYTAAAAGSRASEHAGSGSGCLPLLVCRRETITGICSGCFSSGSSQPETRMQKHRTTTAAHYGLVAQEPAAVGFTMI
eukprot:1463269-Rhodomonas_salina.1